MEFKANLLRTTFMLIGFTIFLAVIYTYTVTSLSALAVQQRISEETDQRVAAQAPHRDFLEQVSILKVQMFEPSK